MYEYGTPVTEFRLTSMVYIYLAIFLEVFGSLIKGCSETPDKWDGIFNPTKSHNKYF